MGSNEYFNKKVRVYVGVDVSKAMLDVYCPAKRTVTKVENSDDGIKILCSQYVKRKSRIVFVMEATGGYVRLRLTTQPRNQ